MRYSEKTWERGRYKTFDAAHDQVRKERIGCIRIQKSTMRAERKKYASLSEWARNAPPSFREHYRVELRETKRRLNRRKRYAYCRGVRYINVARMGGYDIGKRYRKNESIAKILPNGKVVLL
jgi:hypothetical protein